MAASAKTEKKTANQSTESVKSALNSIQENVSERASAVRETVSNSFDTVRSTGSDAAGATVEFGKAYYAGVSILGQTVWGFGQEFYGEVTDHARKTMGAKSVREVAELQASYVQGRIETSASHGKEFIDIAREQAELTMKPIISLLDSKRSA